MAKVINPLLSGSASGQLGHMMTFDKRGYVRQYVVPANPNSANQQVVRESLGDIQRVLKLLGGDLRAELKSGFGYRWNSMIVGELMANDRAALDAYVVEFTAFDAGDKTDWATADTSAPVRVADGAALYAVASAAYDMAIRLGVTLSLTLPATANSSTVAAEWTATT